MMPPLQKIMWTLRALAFVAIAVYAGWYGWTHNARTRAHTRGSVAAPRAAAPRIVSLVPAASERLVTLEVGGMYCADCAQKIEGSLAHVPGVRTVDVNLRSQRARVVCAREVADTTLTAAVRHAGEGYLGLVVEQ